MAGFKTVVFVGVVAVVCRYLYFFLTFHGFGVYYNNHYPGDCRLVGVECGSEQIRVTKDGLAFITNGMKQENICDRNTVQGKILLFDFGHPEKNTRELEIVGTAFNHSLFSPHGMDILDTGASIQLYVISHSDEKDFVEKFEYRREEPEKLYHVESIWNEAFVCLNDLTVITNNEFYVTNWRKSCRSFQMFFILETYLQLHTANIVYYKDNDATAVAYGPGFNGVTLSKDNSKLLVSSCTTAYVHVFDRNHNGSLTHQTRVYIGHFPDNLYTDRLSRDENVFYAGTIKALHRVRAVSEGGRGPLSGSAVKIRTDDNWEKFSVEEIFHDDGRRLVQGVSVAVHYKTQYLFGTIFHKLAYCVEK